MKHRPTVVVMNKNHRIRFSFFYLCDCYSFLMNVIYLNSLEKARIHKISGWQIRHSINNIYCGTNWPRSSPVRLFLALEQRRLEALEVPPCFLAWILIKSCWPVTAPKEIKKNIRNWFWVWLQISNSQSWENQFHKILNYFSSFLSILDTFTLN